MPTLTWWTCAALRFGSMPQRALCASSAFCWASVRSLKKRRRHGQRHTASDRRIQVAQGDGRAETSVPTGGRTRDRCRILVHERQRIAAPDGRLAVLRDIPRKAGRRPEVVEILFVHVAVHEGDACVRIEHHLVERPVVEDRQETEVVVFTKRAVILPLEPCA